jgi:hypothetical protein
MPVRQEAITCDYCFSIKGGPIVDERIMFQIFKPTSIDVCYRCYDKNPSYFVKSNKAEPKIVKLIKDNPAIILTDIVKGAECDIGTVWETLNRLQIKRIKHLWKLPTTKGNQSNKLLKKVG